MSFFSIPSKKKPARRKSRRQRLSVENLESRRVLAAYINEFHYSPLFGDGAEDQYLEFRGTPGETLEVGTYFIGVESADGVDELGDIHTIIDLSNQALGDNGLLVLVQSASSFETHPEARVLQGADGFIGLPATFLADDGAKAIHTGTSSYFLVQTSIAPALDDDIDVNDDGLPDNVYSNWTIHDSFSIVPWVEGPFNQRTFASIVFAEDGSGDGYLPGSTVVNTDQLGYAGRIGDSTGYSAEDWVSGSTVENGDDTWRFQLQHGVFGTPRPYAYGGRILDHVGAQNWYGSIRGTVFQDGNADGVQQASEIGLQGIEVLMDRDDDGEVDFFWETISADDHALGTDLSNISSNVTIVSAGSDNVHQSFKIRAAQEPMKEEGIHVFAHEGVSFFNDNRRLRMDFYEPVRAVSVDVTGNSDLSDTYGRLEIFDENDVSMGFIRTGALAADELENLTLSRPSADIAWAVAYSDENFLSSSPFGRLDNLRFEVPEQKSITNANGEFFFSTLTSDNYPLSVVVPEGFTPVSPASGRQNVPAFYEHVEGVAFGLQGNVSPDLEDQSISAAENLAAGSVLANLPVTLGYATQEVLIRKLSGDATGLFSIDPETFDLILNRAELDFETTTSYTLEIELEDTDNSDLKDQATILITVQDRNDKPVVTPQTVSLQENSADGTVVAQMDASDEDEGTATYTWSILGGNVSATFTIDPFSGEVSVQNPEALDFETNPVFELEIRATDNGVPAAAGTGLLTIEMLDLNEAPMIPDQSLNVFETAAGGSTLGSLSAEDPETGQELSWVLLGGEGSELFLLEADGTLRLNNEANLDFESKSEYLLEVEVEDSGTPNLSATGTVTVVVMDVNEPPVIEAFNFELPENAAVETEVGMVTATDEDEGQSVVFSITGGSHGSAFVIGETSGLLSVAQDAVLDFETNETVTVEVAASDSHSSPLTSKALVTITLQDVNEAPTIDSSFFSFVENPVGGTEVGSVEVSDVDAGDSLTFELVSQTQEWVTIEADTGVLRILEGAIVDFEQAAQNEIVVRVVDAGGLSDEVTIGLQANDANDAPVLVQELPDTTAQVGTLFQYTIPAESFSDQDAGDQLRYVVTDADGFPLPSWLEFDSAAREFSGTPTSDDVGTLTVQVTALDNSGATAKDSFDILVESDSQSWHNPQMPVDSSGDGNLSAVDALLVINYINTADSSQVPDTAPSRGQVDVNDDGFVTAIDALLIINALNNAAQGGEGEGSAFLAETPAAAFDWGVWEDELAEDEEDQGQDGLILV